MFGRPAWLGDLLVQGSSPRYVLGALGLIWDELDRLLLVRQRYRTPGWVLPGGGVRAGETLEACLIREIAEELGWQVEVGPVVGFVGGTYSRLPIGIGDVGFVCYRRSGRFQPSAEVLELRYLPVEQALARVTRGLRPLIQAAAVQRSRAGESSSRLSIALAGDLERGLEVEHE
ncbi:MAG TPA: NUDIX hydrolase [Chloroflexota bacterium]